MSNFASLSRLSADQPMRVMREVVLLTSDRNLRLKALSVNIPVRPLQSFVQWANLSAPPSGSLNPYSAVSAKASSVNIPAPSSHGRWDRRKKQCLRSQALCVCVSFSVCLRVFIWNGCLKMFSSDNEDRSLESLRCMIRLIFQIYVNAYNCQFLSSNSFHSALTDLKSLVSSLFYVMDTTYLIKIISQQSFFVSVLLVLLKTEFPSSAQLNLHHGNALYYFS